MNKAVFLDRDGTLMEDVNYLKKKEEISIYPETINALRNLKKSGYLNIIITNQSGIARGYFSEDDLDKIHMELKKMLTVDGLELIDDIYYSPYHIDGIIEKYKKESNCRKPQTGMIEKAKIDHDLDLNSSFFIGDSYTDMLCAENAGIRKILVSTGYGNRDYKKCIENKIIPDNFAGNIYDASLYILNSNL